MKQWMVCTALAGCLAWGGAAWADGAKAALRKPSKVSSADALGPILRGPGVVKENGPDGPTTDYSMLKSRDGRFEAGVFEAGPSDQQIASYDDDEFMFFLEGSVTLTSADGSVLEAKAGEAVVVPKGWKGRWQTGGYKKYYVTYSQKPAPQGGI